MMMQLMEERQQHQVAIAEYKQVGRYHEFSSLFHVNHVTVYENLGVNDKLMIWQSQAEIKHYSVAYLPCLNRCSTKLPLRAGLICGA